MDTFKPVRLAIVAIGVLASAAAAAPEPPKPAPTPSQSSDHPITVLASADHFGAPAPSQSGDAPRKPRAMRVTTCRCADQTAEPTDDDPKDR